MFCCLYWLRCPQDEEVDHLLLHCDLSWMISAVVVVVAAVVFVVVAAAIIVVVPVWWNYYRVVPLDVLHVYICHVLTYKGVWGWCCYTKVICKCGHHKMCPNQTFCDGSFFLGGGGGGLVF